MEPRDEHAIEAVLATIPIYGRDLEVSLAELADMVKRHVQPSSRAQLRRDLVNERPAPALPRPRLPEAGRPARTGNA